jgi:hypothetical protein
MGNHEQMLVDFLDRPESAGAGLFILNGGGATLSDYAGPGGTFEFPDSHVEFLRGLKLYYENDTHFFVHAGVPNLKLKDIDFENEAMTMMWVRQSFLNSSFRWEKKIVHGHTPVRSPEILSNRINIDTGCVYDGHLTAIELTSAKLYQVEKQVKGETERVPHRADESRVAVRFTGRMPVQARLVGGASYDFETLNYNKFGLLLRELGNSPDGLLKVGDRIEGRIGPEGDEAVYFKGEVMRTESRGANRLYGVKTDAISDGHLGYESVERDKK